MGRAYNRAAWWPTLFLLLRLCHGFYIPGWSAKSFAIGDHIPLFINKIYSDHTQIQYAYSELPFVCSPTRKVHPETGLISGNSVALNLGEILRGDRITVSDYELEMGRDNELQTLCTKTVDEEDVKKAVEIVKKGYVAEWIVDNLPGATSFVSVDKSRKYYAAGFKLGYEEVSSATGQPKYFLNNHVTLVIRYRAASGRAGEHGKKVIVGFEVYPKSLDLDSRRSTGELELAVSKNISDSAPFLLQDESREVHPTLTIPYTYSVYFREDDQVEWANRWDLYFVNQEDNHQIHWLAIINSIIISGLLTAVVAVILARTIRGDIKGYRDGGLEEGKLRGGVKLRVAKSPRRANDDGKLLEKESTNDAHINDENSDDDIVPEDITGWKLVHGDVFRQPSYGLLLASLIGSGMQLVLMAVGLLTLSCFGILHPSFRGGFISVGFALFIVAGGFSGYFSARIYKTFGGDNWRHNALVTATLFPGLLFVTIFILNLFVWAQASSTAIPLGTLVGLVALWLLIQLPLVYAGSRYGFLHAGSYDHPIKASNVPRQIPQQAWYTQPLNMILLAGLIPFAVIFIELLFVFRNLWLDKSGYYYVFGYLAVVSVILILAVMETTIIAVYVQLCAENYHWWWTSFFVGGASAIWTFVYCIYYYTNHLHITGLVSTILFFAYSFLACLVYGLLTGTIGFLTAYAFVRRIYSAIKAD